MLRACSMQGAQAIGRAIVFFQASVEIEYWLRLARSPMAWIVKLESGLVGLAHRFVELLDVEKIRGWRGRSSRRIVRERLIHPCSFRPKGAIGEGFQVANAEIRTAKRRDDAGVGQSPSNPGREKPRRCGQSTCQRARSSGTHAKIVRLAAVFENCRPCSARWLRQ